jgi:hypothetical protein
LRESQIDNRDVCRWDISDISMEMGSAQDRRIIEGRFEGLGRDFFSGFKALLDKLSYHFSGFLHNIHSTNLSFNI